MAAALLAALAIVPVRPVIAQTSVKFAYFPAVVDTPAFVAKEQGFFKKNGLDVEMIPFTTGPALMGSLLSGSTPFADGGGGLLVLPQVAKGHKIRGVANFWSSNFYTLIVRSELATPNAGKPYPAPIQDLKGKKIGVTALGSFLDVAAQSLVRDAGLDPAKDVTIIGVGAIGTAIPALTSGNIDAYISYAPMNELLDVRHPGSYRMLLPADQFPLSLRYNLFNHVTTTQDYIDKNPAVVQAMCKSIQESFQWLSDPANFDAAVKILEKSLPGNPEGVMAKALRASLPALLGDGKNFGKFSPASIENANKMLVERKLIPQAVPYDTFVHKGC